MFNYSPSFARALKTLKAQRTVWYTNTFVHRISKMRTLLKYLASYMTFFTKFLHLGKHKHFPCVLVSKFLMSNPKNVNLESEVKYLSCQLTYTSNPFSIVFVSGSTAKHWALMATPRLVVCFGFFFLIVVRFFSPHIQSNSNWSLIPAVSKWSKPKQGNSVELTFRATDDVAAAPHHVSGLVWHCFLWSSSSMPAEQSTCQVKQNYWMFLPQEGETWALMAGNHDWWQAS